MFVSQIAGAAEACMVAMASSPASAAQAMPEDCDGTPVDAAACRIRCLSQDQSTVPFDQPAQSVAIFAHAEHAAIMPVTAPCPSQLFSAARLPGGPPLRILHCSYQV
jgi:hypothetical protein